MRLFTPETATRTLPLVRQIVDDIRRAYRRLEAARAALEPAAAAEPAGAERERVQGEFDTAAAELTDLARELEPVGCVLKDPALGLIDYPAEQDGDRIWLCWQPGEAEVAFWHPYAEGFAARRPLPAPAAR